MTRRIGIFPEHSGSNPYISRTRELLDQLGNVSTMPGIRSTIRSTLIPWRKKGDPLDVIIVNWPENIIINKNGNPSIIGIFSYLIYLLVLKKFTQKLVAVKHNNFPHNTNKAWRRVARHILNISERIPEHIIVHSGDEITRNRLYIPHPLYVAPPPKSEPPLAGGYFLVFGRIMPYKGILELISTIPRSICLIIAGPAPDKAYLDRCMLLSKGLNKNITFIPEFVSDEQASTLAHHSNGIIVANHEEDMIVSGSHLYALSTLRPLISLNTPYLKWLTKNAISQGISLFDDIESLCKHLQLNDKFLEPLRNEVEDHFGDATLILQWQKLIESK